MASRHATANSLQELLLAAGNLAALTRPLREVLPELALPVNADAISRYLGPLADLPVRQFLARKDLHRSMGSLVEYRQLLSAFRKWLDVQPQVEAAPEPDALERAFLDLGIPDVLEWPVGLLTGTHDHQGSIHPLKHLLAVQGPGRETWRRMLTRDLSRAQARLAVLRAALRHAPLLTESSSLPTEEPLRTLMRAFAELRQSHLAETPIRFPEAGVQLRAQGQDLLIFCLFEGQHASARLLLREVPRWHLHPRLECACGHAKCHHQAAALDVLLEEGCLPGSQVQRQLIEALKPAWRRALDEFQSPAREVNRAVGALLPLLGRGRPRNEDPPHGQAWTLQAGNTRDTVGAPH